MSSTIEVSSGPMPILVWDFSWKPLMVASVSAKIELLEGDSSLCHLPYLLNVHSVASWGL